MYKKPSIPTTARVRKIVLDHSPITTSAIAARFRGGKTASNGGEKTTRNVVACLIQLAEQGVVMPTMINPKFSIVWNSI